MRCVTALRVWLAASLGCLITGPAFACLVCVDMPEESLTERIWSADTVAFARPDPDNPFAYRPVTVLKGDADAPIPFLVDSNTRRIMALRPDRVALVLRHWDGTWALGPQGGADLAAFVRSAIDNERIWTDNDFDPERARAFLAMHAHLDPALRRLALTEMARLPYAQLREVSVALPTEWIARRINDPGWLGWHPVLVKLLGLHDNPAAHDHVRRRAMTARGQGRVPWLVALIEIDGAQAIDAILSADLAGEAGHAAVKALTVHGIATPQKAGHILPALRTLAHREPALAAAAVPALIYLGDDTLVPHARAVLEQGVEDDPTAHMLGYYVAVAEHGLTPRGEVSN